MQVLVFGAVCCFITRATIGDKMGSVYAIPLNRVKNSYFRPGLFVCRLTVSVFLVFHEIGNSQIDSNGAALLLNSQIHLVCVLIQFTS